ncbi:MAG: 5'-nucleotidase C-terminal domain-containing protein, partial [Nitrospirae bacterium]|nr:5'-nucleotidase C-terminal domain-containing protein [Nitrospirota bacterium]
MRNLSLKAYFSRVFLYSFALLLVFLHSCQQVRPVAQKPYYYTLTIAHVNDTHGHLEPEPVRLAHGRDAHTVDIGGFTRLSSALEDVRRSNSNVVFLHAGDVFVGTPYFLKYLGQADLECFNAMGLNALALGNHEFDKGPAPLSVFIKGAKFPVLSANVDFSGEPLLRDIVKPYAVLEVGGEKIGVIGVTTPDTQKISQGKSKAIFFDPLAALQLYVVQLKSMGVNKIILLSHLGYGKDLELAEKLSGVDVIVGGHSHTLLAHTLLPHPLQAHPLPAQTPQDSDVLKAFGLFPEGPYPTEVKGADGRPVLVVQAWDNGKELGVIKVDFDADGVITSYKAEPVIIVSSVQKEEETPAFTGFLKELVSGGTFKVYHESYGVHDIVQRYKSPIEKFMKEVVAKAGENLIRGYNTGPGPLVADSFAMKTRYLGVSLAIVNAGAIRSNLFKGDVTVGDVYTMLPFGDTLVVMELTGKQLREAIEESVDFLVKRGKKPPYLYVSGFSLSV